MHGASLYHQQQWRNGNYKGTLLSAFNRETALPKFQQKQQKRRQHLSMNSRAWTLKIKPPNEAHARRLGIATAMKAKGADKTTSRRALPPQSAEGIASSAEIAVGTRIRLRDTGRLGTVVRKRRGGWWTVDLLERLGGPASPDAAESSVKPSGGGKAGPGIEGRDVSTQNVTVVASKGFISTRRVNMEPLGGAYASPSNNLPVVVGGTATATLPAATAKRRRSAPTSSGSRRNSSDGSTTTVDAVLTAVREGAAGTATATNTSSPELLRGKVSEAVPVATEAVSIRAMSAEGLPHAEMKEWLVFSDLHVSPGSLDVTLEASAVRCLAMFSGVL